MTEFVPMDEGDPMDRPSAGHVRSLEALAAELDAARARLQATIDSSLDAIVTTDTESVIVEWSRQAEAMFGWTVAEAVGRRLTETIIPPEYRERHERGMARYLATGEGPILNRRIEITALRRDGSEFPVELTVAPASSGSRTLFTAFIRDLTERRRAEEERDRAVAAERDLHRELELERARLREIFMRAPALISVTEGPEHRIVLANPAYQRMAGGRELVGRTIREALPELEGQGFFEMRDRVLATGEPHVQTSARVLADLDGDGRPEESFLNFVTQPLTDGDGRVTGILTFAVDVTEQVRANRLLEEQAAELEAHTDELQQQAAQLEVTQTELEMVNDELSATTREAESARAAAESANQAKSHFLANMSHELRTPINAIVGYAELLATGVTGPVSDEQKAQLERIRVSSQHLLMLIEDVLDLSKIEAGGIEVAREAGRIRDAVSSAILLVEPQAAEKELRITDHCRRQADHVFLGDEDRVSQILTNLLSNAVKFTGPGGMVRVSCEVCRRAERGARVKGRGPWLCVRVEDSGIGISREQLPAVFEPFVQVETNRSRARGGAGLGLTISRRLARLMDGDLTVRSEPGKGSCFTLYLPTIPPEGAGDEAPVR